MESVWFVVDLISGLIVYFLPTIIAYERKHHNTLAIFVLNLLTGWTVIGWIGALVWSATAVKKEQT